jgi:hypothetical protein
MEAPINCHPRAGEDSVVLEIEEVAARDAPTADRAVAKTILKRRGHV